MLKLRMALPPTANHRLLPVKAGNGVRMVKAPRYREWLNRAVASLKEQARHADLMRLGVAYHQGPSNGPDFQNESAYLPPEALPIDEQVTVLVVVRFPDRRRCDLDNVLKGVNDALVQAGILKDDSLITTQVAQRYPDIKGGLVEVYITLHESLEDTDLAASLSRLTY